MPMTADTNSPQKPPLHPVTSPVCPNGHPDTCWKTAAVQAILAALVAGDSYGSLASRLGFNRGWLHMVAHGKRPPTRRLARALGIVTERDGDMVRFAVWMTRAERRELQAAIDASGMTRLEWLQAAAETQPLSSEVFAGWCVWRDGER